MLNKKERMEKLNNAGLDTSKYFTLNMGNGNNIRVTFDKNGTLVVVKDDPIAEQIIEDGYVRNTKLHRRFVMAQMFQMLNYVSYDGQYAGYNECLKRMYGYGYTFKMMLDEVKVLSKLEVRDRETFDERSHFFTKGVIAKVIEDYTKKLEEYINTLPTHKCKGVPYKKIKGKNVFCADLGKKYYQPVLLTAIRIGNAKNYTEVYKILSNFTRNMLNLPYNTPKSKDWIDAYKGEGAYFSIKNLVLFNGCNFYTDDGDILYTDSINKTNYLKAKLDEYYGEGWRMFALMKKVIADNGFNFNKRMKEIYSED